MDTTIVLIAVVVVLLVIIGWLTYDRRRSTELRSRFGSEYQRTVEHLGDRRAAEDELATRARRVEALEIKSLSAAERDRFATQWRSLQERFVDQPAAAIEEADELIGELMAARGYPVTDFEQRAADVSVDHPDVVEHYRAAHAIAERDGRMPEDTEALRQAMVHYRALFMDLLETPEADVRPSEGPAATPEERELTRNRS